MDNNISMQRLHEREALLSKVQEILKDRTIRIDERHTFEYFQAYFMKLPNRKDYLNRLYQTQKQKIEGLSFKEKCALFNAMYDEVKQRRKVIFPKKKAYYRKVRFRGTWTPCHIQCDENNLSIFKEDGGVEQCKQLDIGSLGLSKGFQKNGEYYEFQIVYRKKQYQISFQSEYYCASLHQKLTSLVQLKKLQQLNIMDYESKKAFYFRHSRKTVLKSLVVQKKEASEAQFFRVRAAKHASRWPISRFLQQKIKQFQEYNQMDYSLVKNIANGNISHCRKKNSLKINLIIPKVSIDVAIESYLQFQEWNSQIQVFSIDKMVEQSSYLAYLKMKQYSLLTYQRQTHLRITYVQEITPDSHLSASFNESDDFYRHKNKYYLFILSQPHESDNNNTKMNLNQLIEFSQLSDTTIFMTIIHELDFNSYWLIASNFDVSMAFFKDIEFINNLCSENMFRRKKIGLAYSRDSKKVESQSKMPVSTISTSLEQSHMQKGHTMTTDAPGPSSSSDSLPTMKQLQF